MESDDIVSKLRAIGQERSEEAGAPILFQGADARTVGLIISGTAKAVAYSAEGEETWLGRFSPGEFFGHMAFLTNAPVRYEIAAETDVTLCMISARRVEALMRDDKRLSERFAKDLALRLDVMMTRLVEALTLSARGRICAELLRLSNPIGISPDRWVIRPNPVFVELALRINSTRETVSRTVSDLDKKGIISREAGAIVINQPDRLKDAVR